MNSFSQKLRLVLFMLTLVFHANAQIDRVASCLKQLKHCGEDTTKVVLLNTIAWDTSYRNLQVGFAYGEQGYTLAKKLNYKKGLAEACITVGAILMDMGKHDEAMKYYYEGLNISQENHFNSEEAHLYMLMGVLYGRRDETRKEANYYLKAVEISKQCGDTIHLYGAMNNLGSTYHSLKKDDSAFYYLNNCVNHNIKNKDDFKLAYNYGSLSGIFNDKKEYSKALDYRNKEIELAQKKNDKYLLSFGFVKKGDILTNMKRYPEAITVLEEAKKLADVSGEITVIKECNQSFSLAYELMGDHKKALEYYKKFILAKDSMLNKEKNNQIRSMEADFNIEKKDKENKLLQAQNEIAKSTIKQQKIIALCGISGLIMAFVVIIIIFKYYQKEKKSKRIIHLQKAMVDVKNKEIIDSIRYAKTIQQAIIPSDIEVKNIFPDSFVLLLPKDIVSGDFYWVGEKDSYLFAVVADSTGHGVPGGFMSMLGTALLNEIINEKNIYEPSDILDMLKLKIITALRQSDNFNESKDGMDISICRIHRAKKELTFAGANHSSYLIKNNEIMELKGNKQPIGISMISAEQFTQQTISINENDTLYLFTDGYADQFGGEQGKKFKSKQLKQLLLGMHQLEPQKQYETLIKKLEEWKGNLEQVDDICIMGIKNLI